MQIVSIRQFVCNVKICFLGKIREKKNLKCHLLKFYPECSALSCQVILAKFSPHCASVRFSVFFFLGLEMISKLSQLVDNEYVLTEKLDTFIYEEIAKYLTIQDIQLIVSSLEALYQLSELGEATTSKIAEVSNTIGKNLDT